MKRIATGVIAGMLVALGATSAMAQSAYDDATCRQYASQQAGAVQAQANNQAVGSTLGGALLGAGIGAAIGGGRGAAIGAGAGALTGGVAGSANAQDAGNQAYWSYYNQCMASRTPAPPPPGYGQPQGGYYGQPSSQQLNQQQLNQGPQYYNR
jgi:YmgG-like glycine-zipper protein